MTKKTNPLVYVGVGCLVLLILASIGGVIVMKFVASKVGTSLGTNLQDLKDGKMTFTDSKTGTTVNVGTSEIPKNFPPDFPIYPGVKVTSSLSGDQDGKSNGFWLTLSSSDSVDKIAEFYSSAFETNGWTTEATYTANGTTTQTVKKGTMSGSLSIVQENDSSETQIVIVVGEQSN